MKHSVIVLALVLLVLFVSCSRTPPEQLPVSPPPLIPPVVANITESIQKDPCEGIKCDANEQCKEGQCFCKSNFRQCTQECIPVENCCSDADCRVQETCLRGKCEKTQFCDFRMHYEPEKGTCACDQGTRYCFDQGKCINSDSCCDIGDCNPTGDRDRACTPTKFRAEICLHFLGGSHCKKAVFGERNSFAFGTDAYDVFIDKLRESGIADVRAESLGRKINISLIRTGETLFSGNISIENKGNDVVGGNCKSA